MSAQSQTKTEDFVISRTFAAPRDLVWAAFTEADRLKQWFGPKGFAREATKLDFRVGGVHHYMLRTPDGTPMWGKWVFREIEPKTRIVAITGFSDEAGGITVHPMAPTWPRQMLSTFLFEDAGAGKTKVTVRWAPYDATDIEIQTFEAGRPSMTQGWNGTMELLEAYLAKAK
jgi:uncharacterized protein YndB with AHSA1/START domain